MNRDHFLRIFEYLYKNDLFGMVVLLRIWKDTRRAKPIWREMVIRADNVQRRIADLRKLDLVRFIQESEMDPDTFTVDHYRGFWRLSDECNLFMDIVEGLTHYPGDPDELDDLLKTVGRRIGEGDK